jgi:hypothetical protein
MPLNGVYGVMSTSVPTELHHLVCRECSLECLLDAHGDADALRRDHVAATGHRVVVDRVQ